ncbi:acyl-CoA dehydrogenase family protein [Rhodohalobacter sp. 8-1]|uniref:acyl-CoA dehydrogenase family protein n=1 Tax=Rhodohalobacter sp. 8-1 TaxID=3131972 RepID=UPI0030ED3955
MDHPGNKVLTANASVSSNFFESDRILRDYLNEYASPKALKYMRGKLFDLGGDAATVMDSLSMDADKNEPELIRRTPHGEPLNRIQFHPSYWVLLDIAGRSEMFYVKYDPELREIYSADRHKLGFAAGSLYAMSELGQYCPLCMTDGAAVVIDKFADDSDKKRLIPRLSSRNGDGLFTGAMYLTEKAGGSDVGQNRTTATKVEDDIYHLNGEKWFCSNANADVILALARTDPVEKGTRGLSLFLVEKKLEDGSRNPMDIIRLKEKMGVRSMATAEVMFTNTVGKKIGDEGEGFKVMAEMVNMSRLYNAVAAVSGTRRAIIEAWQYLNYRVTFGKRAVEHPMIRQKFTELGAKYVAGFLLTWRTIRALDAAENGDEREKTLLRILTPMTKWWTAENSVYSVRECMELMGGNGYIEGFIMPKLFRDVNVLPIWEGSGNIIVLDILRAIKKTNALDALANEIRSAEYKLVNDRLERLLKQIKSLPEDDPDIAEPSAKVLFDELIRLTQTGLVIKEAQNNSHTWAEPAAEWLLESLDNDFRLQRAPSLKKVESLIGWEV